MRLESCCLLHNVAGVDSFGENVINVMSMKTFKYRQKHTEGRFVVTRARVFLMGMSHAGGGGGNIHTSLLCVKAQV